MPTKNQLLETIEIQRANYTSLLNRFSEVNRNNTNLRTVIDSQAITIRNSDKESDNLYHVLEKTRADFEAYKVGAQTFQSLAEEEITQTAAVNTKIRIKLLNSLTAKVYSEAKATAGR